LHRQSRLARADGGDRPDAGRALFSRVEVLRSSASDASGAMLEAQLTSRVRIDMFV
jgi:hypothetical protein